MSKYYELIKNKNDFLDYLIHKYNENPKEGKRNFILSYLRYCSLFMSEPYLKIIKSKRKSYLNVFTHLREEDYDSAYFVEINADKLNEIEEVDYIRINTANKESFDFTLREYEKQESMYITGGYIKIETWIENDNNVEPQSINTILFDKIKCSSQTLNEKYDYVDLDIKPKELMVIGGRPAMGKTILSINTALNEIDKGGKVLYITLSDMTLNIARKTLEIRSKIPLCQSSINQFTKDEYKRAQRALAELKNIEVIECSHYNIQEIKMLLKHVN